MIPHYLQNQSHDHAPANSAFKEAGGLKIIMLLAAALLLMSSCGHDKPADTETEHTDSLPGIVVSPLMPADIFANGDSASKATLVEAAMFAWQEFIALNWPAQDGFRDSANAAMQFGNNPVGTALVWHTFRHKVEIFPGNDSLPSGYDSTASDYGYNSAPHYLYKPSSTNTHDGHVAPYGQASAVTPWINLDETNEIGVSNMFTGVEDSTDNGNMMLYLAKANKQEYIYAAKNKWYGGENGFSTAQANTQTYINANSNTPPPSSGNNLVSLPYGTIEIKTAWRKLNSAELASNRFYTNTVRHYALKGSFPAYIDEVYGMVALHIIHKTPTAPYFIFATFEQADNLLTTDGKAVEDEDGNMVRNMSLPALTPNLTVTNAHGASPMKFTPAVANATPGKSLYYKNTISTLSDGVTPLPDSLQLTTGTIQINKRLNPIPPDIISVNKMAHSSISNYNPNAVWQYYKLINVQHKPINKPTPGVDYHGPDSASYYQSNSVVESDYVLQKFSGRFYTLIAKKDTLHPNSITDFQNAPGYPPAHNAYNNGKFLMGGCMGCHGNATNGGSDYSFIFGSPVLSPSTTRQITSKEAVTKLLEKFRNTDENPKAAKKSTMINPHH